jgi:DNA-binding MarR family transcriptional regulator
MELGELKTFVTVAAEHSFSLAAMKLCRTQPAVNQAIRRLEEDLGERLFDRSAKQPTLTQAGDALLPEAIRRRRLCGDHRPHQGHDHSRGENLSPREIEEFLHTHEKVSDVQVIGVPDHKYGEEVCAWILLDDGVTATADEFRDFCRGQIATFKIPRYIRFTGDFPMTVTGKVQKFRMREITVAELALARVTNVEPT